MGRDVSRQWNLYGELNDGLQMYVRDRVSLALLRHVGPISITNIECDAVIPLSVIT